MIVLLFFSFLAGIVTILSPCILPILPIVLSSSLTGGKKRPFGVIVGFVASFTFFTLALTSLVRAYDVDPDFLRSFAVAVIFIFGLTILVPKLSQAWEKVTSKIANKAPRAGAENTGFSGGVLVGLSLGLIWTPCAGPILASVITLAATAEVTFEAILITLAYSLGTALPMMAIIYGGRQLLQKVPFLLKNTEKIQKFFGVLLILLAIGIHFNIDRKFQAYILEKFPQYGTGLTQIEELDVVKDRLDMLREEEERTTGGVLQGSESEDGGVCEDTMGVARGIEGGQEWINSEPLALEELRGKVVVVDFWTYSCINCIRTLPHLRAWHESYADDGLVILGVHTPEFEFEKSLENLQEAVTDFELEYPIVQDNDYTIWRRYNNRYWPAKYFVDKKGCLRWTHFGEGEYEESEELIRELLEEDGPKIEDEMVEVPVYDSRPRTSETYVGYGRIDNFVSPEGISEDELASYSVPEELAEDEFAFEGEWTSRDEFSAPEAGSKLVMDFVAQEVFLVMRRADESVEARVRVYLDGEVVGEIEAGEDVVDGVVNIDKDRLYRLIKQDGYESRLLELEFLDGNVEVFAFTFS